MKIYVIRHGLTQSNKLNIINGQERDEPLEPEGIEQVKNAIANLPAGISRIYSSDLLRTRQTAEIVNNALNLEISFHPQLREIKFGNLSGGTWKDAEEQYGKDLRQEYNNQVYDFTPYNGESFDTAQKRIGDILQTIKSNHSDDETVLLVAHGGIVRLLSHLYTTKPYKSTDNAGIREFDI